MAGDAEDLVEETPAGRVLHQLGSYTDLTWVGVLCGEGGGVLVYLRHHTVAHVDALLDHLGIPVYPVELHDGRGSRVCFAPLAYLAGGLSVDWVCDRPGDALAALLAHRAG